MYSKNIHCFLKRIANVLIKCKHRACFSIYSKVARYFQWVFIKTSKTSEWYFSGRKKHRTLSRCANYSSSYISAQIIKWGSCGVYTSGHRPILPTLDWKTWQGSRAGRPKGSPLIARGTFLTSLDVALLHKSGRSWAVTSQVSINDCDILH